MSRDITKPSIIKNRLDTRDSNNLWNYVLQISKDLKNNPINADKSITVEFYFAVNQPMIDQIVELYETEGWFIDVGVSQQAYKSYSGHTVMEFSANEL